MPRKRTGKKKNGKRSIIRRRRRLPLVAGVGFASGMPQSRRVSLRYCTNIVLTSTMGTLSKHYFRATSLFDPDQTGTGHQPMGYDQMGALYNHYVVLGSKITVRAMPDQNGDVNTAVFGVYTSDDTSTPYSDYTGFIEAKRGAYKCLTNQRNQQTIKYKFSTKKFFNIKDVADNRANIGASIGSNPTEEAYFILYYQNLETPGETSEHNFLVTIDFIAEYSEPKDLTQS